jgi:hypothetical protein
MAGRPKNRAPTRKAEPMLPAGAYACLQSLAAMAYYGSTPNEVARYLILRGLDDLIRSRVIHDRTRDEPSVQHPVFEGSAIAQGAELTAKH